MNLFLEPLQCLADPFPDLRKLARTEDNEHDDQDND
jgi:hypothetical protein